MKVWLMLALLQGLNVEFFLLIIGGLVFLERMDIPIILVCLCGIMMMIILQILIILHHLEDIISRGPSSIMKTKLFAKLILGKITFQMSEF